MVEVTGGKPAVQPDVRFEVDVEGGKVAGGIYRFEASVGDLVEITVRSNVADDVHLHVYDLKVPVHEGMPAVLLVEVDIAGSSRASCTELGSSSLSSLSRDVPHGVGPRCRRSKRPACS